MNSRPIIRLSLVALILLAGYFGNCSPKPQIQTPPIVYPAALYPARIEFLAALGHTDDFDTHQHVINFHPLDAASSQTIFKPYGLAFINDRLFLCDTKAGGIWIMDIKHRTRKYLQLEKLEVAGNDRLANLVQDDAGNMYIVDISRKLVLLYDRQGRLLKFLANIGSPVDVAVYGNRVYILDFREQVVQVWNKDLTNLVAKIGKAGAGTGEFLRPSSITVDNSGCLYVADTGNRRVQKFNPQGDFLLSIGQPGDTPGCFALPKGLAVDRAGNIYVADALLQNVQLFNPQGKLLLDFGQVTAKGFDLKLPAKIILDYEHIDYFSALAAPDFDLEYLILVSNQLGPNKVNVYGFGWKK